MFFFNRKRTLNLEGFIDVHTHLLPSVDDGSGSVDETLKILEEYEQMGVNRIWFTPHIMVDIPNQSAALRSEFEMFKTLYTGELKLSLAAEYMLDTLFIERLESNDLLAMGENFDLLLVETSRYDKPFDIENIFYQIRKRGYSPVVAHPERYRYMSVEDVVLLQSSGVYLQLNLLSLVGAYGDGARRKAEELLRLGVYDFVANDTHNLRSLQKMRTMRLPRRVATAVESIILSQQSFF